MGTYFVLRMLSFIYGVVFVILGTFFILIGGRLLTAQQDLTGVIDVFTNPAIVSIIVGSLLVVASILGVIGTLAESVHLLRMLVVLIAIIVFGQIIIGILAFINREKTFERLREEMQISIKQYTESDFVKESIDFAQEKFACCGLDTGPNDWDINDEYSCSDSNSTNFCSVPQSCCHVKIRYEDNSCGKEIRSKYTNIELMKMGYSTRGCLYIFQKWIIDRLDHIGASALGLAILHIFGIFLIYLYMTKAEDKKRFYDYKKRLYSNY